MNARLHVFEPGSYVLTYGPNEPAIRVTPGDSIRTWTVDAGCRDRHGKPVPPEKLQSSDDTEFYRANPLVGPFYVEGSEAGDVLAVKIQRIMLNRPMASSSVLPDFGLGTGEAPGKRMSLTALSHRKDFVWKLDLKRGIGTIRFERSRLGKISIPLDPFIGSIGVAPRYGRVETSLTPGEYGGNMDCVETRQGTAIYFPVFVRGAYLAFGDIHAAQGDGELCGVALETTAEVTLKLDIIKNRPLDWPRMEDGQWLMAVGSARPLLDAYRVAHYEMTKWLVDEYGFDHIEAIQLLSQVGRARIGNVCDPNYTVVCKFPKSVLK